MPRLPNLNPADYTPEQQKAAHAIASGPRGSVRGPLAIWLRRPELANRAQALGEYCRYHSALEKHLSELAICITARIWGSEYEWFAHKKLALEAGVPPAILEAIRTNQTPTLTDPQSQSVYEITTTLNQTRKIPDPIYAKAINTLGEAKLVDLIGLLGYYALISMTINTFEIPLPTGENPELE